jgi:transcriptional antiterminator NusG
MGNLDQQFRKVIEEDEQARLVALSGVAQRRGVSRYGGQTTTEALAPDRGQWRALQCSPREERRVVAELGGQRLDAYCPILWLKERHGRGKLREIERPMFPGYAFVRCLPEHIAGIRTVRDVRSVMGVVVPVELRRVKLDLTQLSADAVDAIRLAEACHATKVGRKQLRWNFTPGEQVRIAEGPFAGFYATIVGDVDDYGRIRALISIFGRSTTAAFDADDLEKL